MRIDAHQHFWRLSRGDYGWLTPELAPIYRDFMPGDLAPLLAAAGIARTILVQAAPSAAETAFLLDIAQTTPFVAGVVGWVDFTAPNAAATIATLSQNPRLVGLRPMIHDIADPDWMLHPQLEPAFAAMQRLGLVFDALVRPVHLARLIALADRHPALAIVVDHAAKPDIASGRLDPWQRDMLALSARPNVACKLSGLVTEAGAGWTIDRLRPYVAPLIAYFGPQRLIFGSDWPVCTLAAGYGEWSAAVETLLAGLAPAERQAVFGGNAERVYLSTRGTLALDDGRP